MPSEATLAKLLRNSTDSCAGQKTTHLPEWTASSGAVYADEVRITAIEFQKLVESGTSGSRNVLRERMRRPAQWTFKMSGAAVSRSGTQFCRIGLALHFLPAGIEAQRTTAEISD